MQIKGEIDTISFQNPENGWSVFRLKTSDYIETITVTGYFSILKPGEYIAIEGQWTEHRQYGKQFKSTKAELIRPSSKDGIMRYLSSGVIHGIGPKIAEKIVTYFGDKTFEILDLHPERLKEVPLIGKKKAELIMNQWSESKRFRDIELTLTELGFSPLMIQKVIAVYGHQTHVILKENPYRMIDDIRGIGFITADKLALQMGIAPQSEARILPAIAYALKTGEDVGHCYLSHQQLLSKLAKLLAIAEDELESLLPSCLAQLNEKGVIVSERIEDSKKQVHYLQDLFLAEEDLSRRIASLLKSPLQVDLNRVKDWIDRYCDLAHTPLSEDQKSAVVTASQSRIFILTGGPGVGKTTTANAIVRLFKAMNKTVALAAPTGRAAQRLSEITGLTAKTVHRLLEWNPQINGFNRNDENPLDAPVVILDEASMLDIRIATSLFQAVAHNSQIILIGDVDQLPSVGPGNVLRDLIQSKKIPYVSLKQIFRQASKSDIVQTAHCINDGNLPEFSSDPNSDCRFIKIDDPDQISQAVQDLVANILPQKSNYDPVKDIQVLTPMNRGDLGTHTLNEQLQDLLNGKRQDGQELRRDKLILRPGDKVIQNSNNYDLNVFNGDIGIVKHAGAENGKVYVDFSGRIIEFKKEETYDLKLAYAITIHKAQGSEFPVVIIPIHAQHFIMLQRNLVYTALTRAKKLAIFIGTKTSLKQAIQNQTSQSRQTQLLKRVQLQ